MPNGEIEILITCIVLMLIAEDVVDSFRMSLGCLVSWRECVHFYGYTSNMRQCRFAARFLAVPFVIMVARFRLHPLVTFFGTSAFLTTLSSVLLLLAYLLVRFILSHFMRRAARSNPSAVQAFDVAGSTFNPFFMLCVLVMLATAFILPFFDVEREAISHSMLWEMAFFYTFFIIRKTEIFASYRGFFAGFLYLCTLEIIPSGLLILSAIL